MSTNAAFDKPKLRQLGKNDDNALLLNDLYYIFSLRLGGLKAIQICGNIKVTASMYFWNACFVNSIAHLFNWPIQIFQYKGQHKGLVNTAFTASLMYRSWGLCCVCWDNWRRKCWCLFKISNVIPLMCLVWLLLTFVPHRWSRRGWRPPVSVTEFRDRVPCKHAGGSWHPSTKSASSSSSVTRLQSNWPAPQMRRLGRGKSPRPDPRGSSRLRALERNSFPAPLTFFTSRTRRAIAGLASIRQAPWPANATRIRTVRPSAAAGATTLRAGWWRDRASARCAGAAMLNANSAHKEKRFTPVRGKTVTTMQNISHQSEWAEGKKRGEVTSCPVLDNGLKDIKLVESTFLDVLQGIFFLFSMWSSVKAV